MIRNKLIRVLFYISLIAAIVFTYRSFKIVISDLMNISPYNWGYLAGNFGIALFFTIVAIVTRKRITTIF